MNETRNEDSPIGVIDSGIGGLTVVAAIRRLMPRESIVYLGDTARLPYGTKSAETVIRYARECTGFLVERGIKALVVACNTISAYALPELMRNRNIPVLGVVEPGALAAVRQSKGRVIGVIGTAGTIASNAYGKALKSLDSNIRVVSRACPLFVPLVEEGWLMGDVTDLVARRYLDGMKDEGMDVLILGCTHYPMIADAIGRTVGEGIALVDSAETTASALSDMLEKKDLAAPAASGKTEGKSCRIYVTDLSANFERLAGLFLGRDSSSITRVDL